MELKDKIGRSEIVDKVCGLVDSLQKNQNFCLSINGAWGSGKTFVLGMIEERLAKKQEYIIVKYDAWENTFYSDPLIAMLYCILDTLEKAVPEEVAETITEKREQKTTVETVKKAGKAILETAAKNNRVVGFINDAITKVKSVIKSYKETALTNNAQVENYKSYSVFLKQTIEQLNEITTQELCEEKQIKLIVLVDEIDRCLPDEQLKILERLHHLFDVKNCAVIVAMNQDCIVKTVQTVYGIDGYEYLRKFFDFTFKLEMSASRYLKGLLEDFIENFKKVTDNSDEYVLYIKLAYQCLLYGDSKVLNKVDNRELSRYYKDLLNICNDFGWDKLSKHYVFFVIIALFIRKNISITFLSKKEIIENQTQKKEQANNPDWFFDKDIPYFDYLIKYLGVDRVNLPKEIKQNYGMNPSKTPEFSLYFNEIVHYSLGEEFNYNTVRIFNYQPTVKSEDCQKLRQLIILYGGEQERCVK